jgi:hypothetical protein
MIDVTERVKQLEKLQMKFDFKLQSFVGKEEINKDFYVHNNDILYTSKLEWKNIIQELTYILNDRKTKKIKGVLR